MELLPSGEPIDHDTPITITDDYSKDPTDDSCQGAAAYPLTTTLEHLQALKRPQLLSLCKQHGIKAAGKNIDLIERLVGIAAEKRLTKEQLLDGGDANDFAVEDCGDEQAIKEQCNSVIVHEDGLHCGESNVDAHDRQASNPFVASIESPKMHAIEVHAQAPKVMERIAMLATPKHASPRRASVSVSAVRETIFSTIDRQEGPVEDERQRGAAEQLARQDNAKPRTNHKATTALGKPGLAPPAARSAAIGSTIDRRPTTSTSVSARPQVERKKFDLKASLAAQRPLNYKPYTGPLKNPVSGAAKHAAK